MRCIRIFTIIITPIRSIKLFDKIKALEKVRLISIITNNNLEICNEIVIFIVRGLPWSTLSYLFKCNLPEYSVIRISQAILRRLVRMHLYTFIYSRLRCRDNCIGLCTNSPVAVMYIYIYIYVWINFNKHMLINSHLTNL